MDIKTQLTKDLLKIQAANLDDEKIFKRHLILWWKNPMVNGNRSLGLTIQGYQHLKNIIKFYQIDLSKDIFISNQLIIWLDKFIDCPYYLTEESIFVSKESTAVQLILFGGDLTRFGSAKVRPKQRLDKNQN